MDNHQFIVTVHGDNGHVAEYEVHAPGAITAIEKAMDAYGELIGDQVTVCEVRLYNGVDTVKQTWDSVTRYAGVVTSAVEKEQATDELPGYTWAQQHGFSMEAWLLFGRLVGSAYINGNSFIAMSKWLGYADDDEFETIIDRMTDYQSRILFGVVEG